MDTGRFGSILGARKERHKAGGMSCIGRYAAVAVMLGLSTLSAGGSALAGSGPRIVRLANPAIAIVINQVRGQVTLPAVELYYKHLSEIQTYWQDFVNHSSITESQFTSVASFANPYAFLAYDGAAARRVTVTYTLDFLGTGFFVTGNGFLLTNAHVVRPSLTEIKAGLVQLFTKSWTRTLENHFNSNSTWGGGFTFLASHPKYLTATKLATVNRYFRDVVGESLTDTDIARSAYAGFSSQSQHIYIRQGVSLAGNQIMAHAIPARLVVAGQPYPGEDVAVLKATTGPNPEFTLSIGNTSNLSPADPLLTDTYPFANPFSRGLAAGTQFTPTVTNGIVSKITTTNQNVQVVETNAGFSAGGSGGPALNSAGKVIGLTTASQSGVYDVVGTQNIQDYLQQASVTPQESLPTQLLSKALVYERGSHWKAALGTLDQLAGTVPANPYVQQEINRAQGAINTGQDVPLSSGPATWVILASIAAVVVLLAGLAFMVVQFFASSRRRPIAVAGPGLGVAGPGPVYEQNVVRPATVAQDQREVPPEAASAPAPDRPVPPPEPLPAHVPPTLSPAAPPVGAHPAMPGPIPAFPPSAAVTETESDADDEPPTIW